MFSALGTQNNSRVQVCSPWDASRPRLALLEGLVVFAPTLHVLRNLLLHVLLCLVVERKPGSRFSRGRSLAPKQPRGPVVTRRGALDAAEETEQNCRCHSLRTLRYLD